MKAILLAAGFGTRLRPLTDSIPKCLVPIGGKPLLEIWLGKLFDAGIHDILVNTHYLHEQVIRYLQTSSYRDGVTVVHEPVLLGTAGTLRANLGFLNGDEGMLIHADNFYTGSLDGLLLAHAARPQECDLTMATFQTDKPSACGIVQMDASGVVIGFQEKVANPSGNTANGAVYVLGRGLLDRYLREFGTATDFSTQVLPHLLGHMLAWSLPGYFIDIGTPEAYRQACQLVTVGYGGGVLKNSLNISSHSS